jgi:hypothetical protein
LIGKSTQPTASIAANVLQLADQDEIPQNAQLTFSIHAQVPAAFTGEEKIEVGTIHGAHLTTLTLTNGLILEDSQVAVATLDTDKAFAASAWGPLRFRVIENGAAGDWKPLTTLVRLPVFGDLKCPDSPNQLCKLNGSKLFLVDSLSIDPQFTHPIQVPVGFPGYFLSVPRPTDGQLYVKLHDDPSIVNPVVFPVANTPLSASAAASPKPAVPNPTAAGTQSSPLPTTTTAITTTGQNAVAPQVSAPSTPSSGPPAPPSNKTEQPPAIPAASPATEKTQLSVSTTAPSGSKTLSSPHGSATASTKTTPSPDTSSVIPPK